MSFDHVTLENDYVTLEPFAPGVRDELRASLERDPNIWSIMVVNPIGEGFDSFWSSALGASPKERLPYVIRRRADGCVVGTSTFYTALAEQGGVEIGTSYFQPDARGGAVNPAAKLLMLDHAFASGMVRVQFRVDTRNLRSQAAVAKLGAVREGVLRKDRLTWTGYVRDTVYYSILASEWPAVNEGLLARLAAFASPFKHP